MTSEIPVVERNAPLVSFHIPPSDWLFSTHLENESTMKREAKCLMLYLFYISCAIFIYCLVILLNQGPVNNRLYMFVTQTIFTI